MFERPGSSNSEGRERRAMRKSWAHRGRSGRAGVGGGEAASQLRVFELSSVTAAPRVRCEPDCRREFEGLARVNSEEPLSDCDYGRVLEI